MSIILRETCSVLSSSLNIYFTLGDAGYWTFDLSGAEKCCKHRKVSTDQIANTEGFSFKNALCTIVCEPAYKVINSLIYGALSEVCSVNLSLDIVQNCSTLVQF